jgi:hypothetical protein
MEVKDIIGVLQSVKRREIANNNKNAKLYTNPDEGIGAKAIDAAIEILNVLNISGMNRDCHLKINIDYCPRCGEKLRIEN